MSACPLQLIQPRLDLQAEFADFLDDFRSPGETKVHGLGSMCGPKEPMDAQRFAAGVERCRREDQGIDIAPDRVPATTFWLFDGQGILGTSNLRHRLSEFLLREGGHIGYSVRPSRRRQGMATRLLALTLAQARQRGIDRALLVCDKTNIASAGVIGKNGGVLENEVISTADGALMQRYWIDLTAGR